MIIIIIIIIVINNNNNNNNNYYYCNDVNPSSNKQVVLVKEGMEKYISKIPRNIKIQRVQKCVLLRTACSYP